MDRYKVYTDEKAVQSLDEITDYYRLNASDAVADKVYFGIIDVIESLSSMPSMHPIDRFASTDKKEHRVVIKWKYRIVFHIHEEDKSVEVIDIVHGSRDLEAYFSQ